LIALAFFEEDVSKQHIEDRRERSTNIVERDGYKLKAKIVARDHHREQNR
jgi:hypothetical protein